LPVDTSLVREGASAVILGKFNGRDLAYEGLAEALAVPDSEVRIFAKPESFVNRRMGVALANAKSIEEARKRAVKAASLVVINPAG
jgi:phosphoribosylglycinamide formyltransferase 2